MKTQRVYHWALSMVLVLTMTTGLASGQVVSGPARGQRALTKTGSTTLSSIGAWIPLPGARIQYQIPSGTWDTFSVSFSAECTKSGGSSVRIRLFDQATNQALDPDSGTNQLFCSVPDAAATHSAKWIKRLPQGLHTVEVQFWLTGGTAIIDDWAFELVIYD